MHCVLPIHLQTQADCVRKRVLHATPLYGLMPSAAAMLPRCPRQNAAWRAGMHAVVMLSCSPPHIPARPPATARWQVVRPAVMGPAWRPSGHMMPVQKVAQQQCAGRVEIAVRTVCQCTAAVGHLACMACSGMLCRAPGVSVTVLVQYDTDGADAACVLLPLCMWHVGSGGTFDKAGGQAAGALLQDHRALCMAHISLCSLIFNPRLMSPRQKTAPTP